MNDGFTLIECMLYIFLFSLICTLWFSNTVRIYSAMRSTYHKNHTMLNLYTACDALIRDIRMKPPIAAGTLYYLPQGVAWHYTSYGHSVGWFLQDCCLIRFDGVYNERSDTWSHCTKSVVCNGMSSVLFRPQESGNAFCITLVSGSMKMERTIWL